MSYRLRVILVSFLALYMPPLLCVHFPSSLTLTFLVTTPEGNKLTVGVISPS